jgi:hypothetical protein
MINEKLFNYYISRLISSSNSNSTVKLADLKIGNLIFKFAIKLTNNIQRTDNCGCVRYYGEYTQRNLHDFLAKTQDDREKILAETYIQSNVYIGAWLQNDYGLIHEDEEGNDLIEGNDFLSWGKYTNPFTIPITEEFKDLKIQYEENIDKLTEYVSDVLDRFSNIIKDLRFDSYRNVLDIPREELNMDINGELFWKKALNPEQDNDCCICGDQTKYKTRCGHLMCVDCHEKHLLNLTKYDNMTCPMCRESYAVIVYDNNN